MKLSPVLALFVLGTFACDKPGAPDDKPAAASATAPAPTPPPPPPTASAPPAPSASAASAPSAPTKNAVASVFDPVKEPQRIVNVLSGGSVALYLPEWAGSTWKIPQPDRALGQPKDENIPGFAGPSTPAHTFTWQIKDALKGQTHKVTVTNSAKGRAPAGDPSFTLVINVS